MDLASLFSSKARIKILRTLFYQTTPIALRHIALLANIPVFSVQYALKQLTHEKLIKRIRQKPYVLFELNKNHEYYDFIMEVFKLEMKKQAKPASEEDHLKAQQTLEFSSSANEFFKEVRA